MDDLKKILQILNRNQKIQSIKIFFLMLIGMFFEILGVGLMIPAVTLMVKPEIIKTYIDVPFISYFLNDLSNFNILVWGLLFLIILYFLKTVFLIFLAWYKNKFCYDVLSSISRRMFYNYFSRDWLFYLNNNSATLIRNCSTECGIFVNNIFIALITLFAELMVLFGILILLILIDPISTLINFVIFFSLGFIYQQLFKNKTIFLGKERQKYEYEKIKYLQQGFGALRDIKVINSEKYFINQYDVPNVNSANVAANWVTISQLPRLVLEFVAILCLAGVVVNLIIRNGDVVSVAPTLAMFAAASFRLLPSSNRILGALQSIRFGRASINLIYNELNSTIEKNNVDFIKKNKKLLFNKSICLKNISFKYPSSKRTTLDDINITIPKGNFIGIIGQSGAGKSTLVDILLGLLNPDKGVVEIDDINIVNTKKSWQKKIGYVPQDIYLLDDTLRQNIAFGIPKDKIDNKKVLKAIVLSQLEEFVKTLDKGIYTFFGERGVRLSGGQLQRIAIARALYRDPEILILDEATSALDNETEGFVMESIKNLKGLKTIIIIAHRLTTISNCDYLYKLNKGKIEKQGKPVDLLKNRIIKSK